MKPYIPIVLGTARVGRYSEQVAYLAHSVAEMFDIETELVDVKDFETTHTIPTWEESDQTKKWREIATRASGFIFVVPEYNRSFPGEFKILLDMAHKEYEGKVAGIVGVSSGKIGGARMAEHLIAIFTYLQMRVVIPSVYVGLVQELGKEGLEQHYTDDMKKMIQKLFTMLNT
jgi:NAD(P)H-dependent FMN reductase